MEPNIREIALRIKALRIVLDISEEQMAEFTDCTLEEYLVREGGGEDFSFSFLHKCAKALNVDIVELLTGENPKLTMYSIVRHDGGLPIQGEQNFIYKHLNYRMKDKKADVFRVTAPYQEDEQKRPIPLATHDGQEYNYILKGSLKIRIGNHLEVLHQGDSIFYDATIRHGMIATNGENCEFLAVTIEE